MALFKNLFLIVLFASVSSFSQAEKKSIIEVEELQENFLSYKIIDVSPEADFDTAHIVGAKNLWRADYTSQNHELKGMMPEMKLIENSLIELELTPFDKIVLYDHRGGCDAARLYFILDFYGHQGLFILNGGLKAWGQRNDKVVLDPQIVNIANYAFSIGRTDNRVATLEDVKSSLTDE
ncbi:MAG: thiosulfate/3-mercaptopyruvate sulfurtransferase, partial [Arenicella sp.]